MKFSDFKSKILNKDLCSVYLLEGEEAYFTENSIGFLKANLLQEPNLNFCSLSSDTKADEIIASLSAFPIFDEYRVTLIREFYPDDKFIKNGLKSFLDAPFSNSILVIANSKPTANLKKYSSVQVVDCVKQEPFLIARWVKEECRQALVEIDLETAKMVGEFCLFSMTRVATETAKLIAFAGENGKITAKDVEELVARETEYKIYKLTEYIAERSLSKAIDAINDMLSKGETFQRLIVSVYKYFSRLLHVAISDKTNQELSNLLGVQEFAVKKAKEQAKLFKVKSLKKAVDLLADSDYKIKSGAMNDNSAFWLSLFKIIIS